MIGGLLMFLLFVTSVFLILLVLIQRGRGGGLAGAFGGLGGQSAFGTKAGDLFTRITIVVATAWILLCALSVKYFADENRNIIGSMGEGAPITGAAGGVPRTDATPGAAGSATESAPSGENVPVESSSGPQIPTQSAPPAGESSASPPAGEPSAPSETPPSSTPASEPAGESK